jgi:hypothetical protein
MLKLWNKIQKHRDSLSDSAREKGLFLGLLFSLSALFFVVDSGSTVGPIIAVIAVLYNAYQLSFLYIFRNKK